MKRTHRFFCVLFALATVLAVTAASSPADALCEKNESPCGESNLFPVGTTIESSLPAEGKIHFAGTFHSVDCTTSTMSAETTGFAEPSEPGVAFHGEVISEKFENCSSPTAGPCQTFKTKSVSAPMKLFASTKTAGDGFLGGFAGAQEIEMACTALACAWEYIPLEEFPYVRTFKGGSPPTETVEVTYVRQGGGPLCGKTFVATGERQLTAPSTAFWVR